jgi:Fe-S-cluster containining protein
MTPPFAKTECSCSACVACCKRQPGPLAPGDFETIQGFLGITFEQMKKLFWRSPGALVQQAGRRFWIGTITPQRSAGKCVFLDANERCRIHAVKPAGCAYFDTHMVGRDAQDRSQWFTRMQCDPGYQALRDTLPAANSYSPGRY